jgi:putative cell wall-binding protein
VSSTDGDTLSTEWTFSTIDNVFRSSASDRYGTAVTVSRESFDAADAVILATGADYPDALSAAGLAGSYGAPLLLTRPTDLPTVVRDEIVRLGATKVVIVGGMMAVSDSVKNAVDALSGVSVERIAGADRYATAAQVARTIAVREGGMPKAYVVRGDDFPDALACSPFAFNDAMPILLTRSASLPEVTQEVIEDLGVADVVIAGGVAAVSDSVKNAIDGLGGVAVERIAGLNRYETAAAVAEHGVDHGWGSWGYVGIATGLNFPDALVGGVACGNRGGVLLMTDPGYVSGATRATILLHASSILRIDIFGGTNVVSSAVAEDLGTLLW